MREGERGRREGGRRERRRGESKGEKKIEIHRRKGEKSDMGREVRDVYI